VFDQSAFAKLLVQGRDAELFLQRICAGDISVPVGHIVYTPLLNVLGGIESDLTITRLEETTYLAVTGSAQARRDLDWIRRNIRESEFVTVTDVTSAYATLSISGPRTRDLLSRVTTADLSNAQFPFGTAQRIEAGYAEALALRVSYAGELGWEFHIASDLAVSVLDAVMEAGQELCLKLAGSVALNSLRLEKAFRSWGHDIGPSDSPFEAGLMFAVKPDKGTDFIGRDAALKARDTGFNKRLINFIFEDCEAYPHGREPIYRSGRLAGSLTSASYGHSLDRPIGMGWVTQGSFAEQDLRNDLFEIEIAGRRYAAQPSVKPLYDPSGSRMRS
jgi:4-methylaminobutanoate oxidase (formaldehyde-forming)